MIQRNKDEQIVRLQESIASLTKLFEDKDKEA